MLSSNALPNLTAILAVQRAGNPSAPASVDYASRGGSGTADADYTDVSGTLVFAPGESVRPIAVPLLNDAATESPETFTLTLANPTGGAVWGTRASATVRILSNDTAIGLEFGNYRVADQLFVLAELARWNREDPVFADRLNLDAVAAVGFSFGGVTAAELARIEPRCRAAVLFDLLPWFPAPLSASGVQKPLLQINASDNAEAVLHTRATADAIWFQISRSEHGSMGGHDYYWAWYPADLVNVREAARTVDAFTLAFLNRHLKELESPLLDKPPADFPRIANWKKK